MKKILKIIGISIIVLFVLCGLIFVQDNILYTNDLYIKMNEITDNKSLIGLSETDLIELLGKIGQPVLPTSIPAKLIEQDYEHKFVTDDMIDILKSYKQTIANLTSRIEKLENA